MIAELVAISDQWKDHAHGDFPNNEELIEQYVTNGFPILLLARAFHVGEYRIRKQLHLLGVCRPRGNGGRGFNKGRIHRPRMKTGTRYPGYWLGKKHSDATRKKMSATRQKENNPNWKGGVAPYSSIRFSSSAYKQWRNSIFKRDNFICQYCGQRGGSLNAHHLNRVSKFPNQWMDMTNGITLCSECHHGIHCFTHSFLPQTAKEKML